MKSKLLLLPLLLTLPSCFLGRTTVDQPLDHQVVAHIRPGMSAGEVIERMGGPNEVVQLGKRSAYLYRYRVDKGTGTWLVLLGMYNEDTRSDRVWFFFDENNKLTHGGSTFQSHRTQFHAFPWTDIYLPEDADEADRERGLK